MLDSLLDGTSTEFPFNSALIFDGKSYIYADLPQLYAKFVGSTPTGGISVRAFCKTGRNRILERSLWGPYDPCRTKRTLFSVTRGRIRLTNSDELYSGWRCYYAAARSRLVSWFRAAQALGVTSAIRPAGKLARPGSIEPR